MGKYEDLAKRVGALVDEKNKAYGNSFDAAGDFLRLLWPNGCPPDQFDDLLAMARIFDKMKRIATDKDAFGESPYQDIAGYGILGLHRSEQLKELKKQEEFLAAMAQPVSKQTPEEVIAKAKEMEMKFANIVRKQYCDDDDDDIGKCDECGKMSKLHMGMCEFCLKKRTSK